VTARVRNIRDAFADRLKQIERSETGMLEIIGASFIADSPTIFGRVNEDYVARELAWYDAQSLNVHDIPGGAPPIWERVSAKSTELGHLRPGSINSNYGFLLYHRENGSQYANVVDELHRDKHSRRAVAIYTRPTMHVDSVRDGMQDFVCTNAVHYTIRDDFLHVVVQMRSNDAIFGYRNDYAWQKTVQQRLREDLLDRYPGLKLGVISWQVANLHIYPRHFSLVQQFIETGRYDTDV